MESATGSQLNVLMMRSYLQDAHSIPLSDQAVPFQGAISIGNPGIYNNCVRWDVASLYPSIILTYKIFDSSKDPCGNFLKMVQSLTETRLRYKKLYKETGDPAYDAMSSSIKILANSCYGLLGATGLNFNSGKCATLVTEKGREILTTAIKWATGKELEISDIQDNQSTDE